LNLHAGLEISRTGKFTHSGWIRIRGAGQDDQDVYAIAKSSSYKFARKHNAMTNSLLAICSLKNLEILEGNDPEALFDALILNFNGAGKNLLIEAKSSIDRGSTRLAIGQLFDYKRFLQIYEPLELAILFPGEPPEIITDLLIELRIHYLFFVDRDFKEISGNIKLVPW
jgi:hypothetical protein